MTETALTSYLRLLQTYLPWAAPLKFGSYNLLTRHFGLHIEPEFRILPHLPGIRNAVDVGGNWGQSTAALRRLCPQARVTSFEPNPGLAAKLRIALADDPQVDVHNCALSSVAGNARLFVPAYRGFVFDGLAALDESSAANWLNPRRIAFFDRAKLDVVSHEVAVRTLDSFAIPADFIKIDVQGHELDVLKGAQDTLALRPVVLLECATLEIVRYLSQFGLKPYKYVDGRLVVVHSAANTLFLTDDHVSHSGLTVSRSA